LWFDLQLHLPPQDITITMNLEEIWAF